MVYTDAILGRATYAPGEVGQDLQPLFDTIVNYLPAPQVEPDKPAQLLVTTLAYDDYKGRIAIGRLFAGTLRPAQPVARIALDGTISPGKIAELFVHQGLERIPVDSGEPPAKLSPSPGCPRSISARRSPT